MSKKYLDTFTVSSVQDVAIVRLALIHYQECLRSDAKSFLDRNCFQQAFDDLNSMVRVDNLIKDLDSRIGFDILNDDVVPADLDF